MKVYITQSAGDKAFQKQKLTSKQAKRVKAAIVDGTPKQVIFGFGAALTEASAYTFAQMPESVEDEFLRLCFAGRKEGGNAYNLGRIHLQSCDFALGNYAYVHRPLPGRDVLSTFDASRDLKLSIPFAQCCLAAQPNLKLLASPWSPPAFMKTNHNMNFGGRLKPKHYANWARTLAHAVRTWCEAGLPIYRITCQNEPGATQTWDSCLYTPEQEARFASEFLRPALDAEGLEDVRILGWDHNKEALVSRASRMERASQPNETDKKIAPALRIYADGDALGYDGNLVFSGMAFHWYTGDFFDEVAEARRRYPAAELVHTEGCEAFSNGRGQTDPRDAEHYAHDIIGDMNAGANAYIDWNILLNEQGGPNHVGNFCDAPLMYNRVTGKLHANLSYYYLGHFSRFICRGAHVLESHCEGLESLAVANPQDKFALVALNASDEPRKLGVEIPAHSIATFTW